MTAVRVISLAAACLAAAPVSALEQGEYRFNGFGTVGFTHLGGANDAKSFGVQGQTTDSWRGDQLSKLAGQFQYGLTDKLSATAQLIAKAEQDDWRLNLEWLYLAYAVNEQFTVRGGRLRPAMFLFSDTLDVGYSYPWLRLPDEAYGLVQLPNYEGVEALYELPTNVGTLSLQGSYGQAVNRNMFIGPLDQRLDADFKSMVVASVALTTDSFGTLRYSYSETDLSLGGDPQSKGKFVSLGHRYDNGTWVTNAEAVQRRVEGVTTNDAFYVMGGRRFGDFLPHLTYAQLDESDAGRQTSWTYGLNYSLNANVTLKGEYKRVDISNPGYGAPAGTPGLFAANYSTFSPTFDGDIISVGIDFVF